MASYDRAEQLKQLHEKRKKETFDKVEEAIKRLIKNSKDINFNSVAKEAGISKATLYNNPQLKERIDFLKKQTEKTYIIGRIQRDENNQKAIIDSLKRRIEKLEKKIKVLEKENKQLRSKENEKLTEYFLEI
ncbi:hypothetical protein SAMN05444673_2830 [Bacillus sp. OV166]|uniref:DUF6262 family protein n=1 Tax=Bacillus sp. OV166 TaxID=1882763 RepID=UPI000A2AACFC|nr:DUF6262 family protein [Bacillus sp. OV166]SMQ77501.1 hypothetical protein SAMN05444673_2830 [Bacillus sp. OV166]